MYKSNAIATAAGGTSGFGSWGSARVGELRDSSFGVQGFIQSPPPKANLAGSKEPPKRYIASIRLIGM